MKITQRDSPKTQLVRLADVFVIGPTMVWGGAKLPPSLPSYLLVLFGLATIAYNARNYAIVARR